MRRRDKTLIRELMFRLESIYKPANIFTISMHSEEVQVPGYNAEEIYDHLQQINRAGYILYGDSGPMDGIGFGGFTEYGHDYLDTEHAKDEEKLRSEPVDVSTLEEIRKQIVEIRLRIAVLESNTAKAEIEADLQQISVEIDRPAPKRSAFKSFYDRLREDLLKVGTHEAVSQALQHVEAFARHMGWL